LSARSSAFALLTPLPRRIPVDSVIGNHPPHTFIAVLVPDSPDESRTVTLIVAASLFVVIALLKQLQSFGQLWLTTHTGQRLLLRLRSRLFRHAEGLSLAYHDQRGTADSAYRIQYDAQSVQDVAVAGLIPFVTAALTIAGMIYVTARIDWQLAEGWFGLAIGLIMGSAMAAVLFLGTRRVLAGALTVGNLTLVMGYLQQLYEPLKTASKKAGDLQASLASVERVYELLDRDSELPSAGRPRRLERVRGDIAFERVWFAYERDR